MAGCRAILIQAVFVGAQAPALRASAITRREGVAVVAEGGRPLAAAASLRGEVGSAPGPALRNGAVAQPGIVIQDRAWAEALAASCGCGSIERPSAARADIGLGQAALGAWALWTNLGFALGVETFATKRGAVHFRFVLGRSAFTAFERTVAFLGHCI